MEQKLASIQRIAKISQMEDADKLLIARVLGWQVIVRKDEGFKEGDLAVYCEVDSLLPENPVFEFLRKSCATKMPDETTKFRIRTIKLRGYFSQGLLLKLSVLKEFGWEISEQTIFSKHDPSQQRPLTDGTEVTDILNIVKYEIPLPSDFVGEIKGMFPSFMPKTDETRIQNVPNLLERNMGCECYATEKVDGQSVTYYIMDGIFGACNRTLDLKESPDNAIWAYARKERIEKKLVSSGKNIAIQGEMIGPKIQKNKYKLNSLTLLVFNVFDIERYAYLEFNDFIELSKSKGFQTVPVLNEYFVLTNNLDKLIEMARGPSKFNPNVFREGIVVRSLKEKRDVEVGRLSFKVLNPEFLVKFNE